MVTERNSIEESDDEERRSLGNQIRTVRKTVGMTVEALATAARISPSLVSQVERGLASPSITTLRRVAKCLGIPVASLFVTQVSGPTASPSLTDPPCVVRRSERKGLRLPRSRVRYELLTPNLNRQIEFLWIEYEPGSADRPEPVGHPGEENVLCLKGTISIVIDGQWIVLEAGDSISFDSARPHQVLNSSPEQAIIVAAITPPSF